MKKNEFTTAVRETSKILQGINDRLRKDGKKKPPFMAERRWK